jgi:membrane fusion protein, multidrug efflux system
MGHMNKKVVLWTAVLVIAAGAASGYLLLRNKQAETSAKGAAGTAGSAAPPASGAAGGRRAFDPNVAVPVLIAAAKLGDIDIVQTALGTVTARNTAIVKARVDGQLIKINFREGQLAKTGDLLAQIDPRPFQVQLDQANGQLARDRALLANVQLDWDRYKGLLAKDSIAKQQVDAQEALVRQNQGAVQSDQAQVDNAKLQLSFTRITAPITGRLGLRQVDLGNMVHASDTTGIVVITQTQPIAVIFSIPSDNIAAVAAKLRDGVILETLAYDREGKVKLATGKLLTVDNQIDVTTGTVKLKAEFPNADEALFPNQFVNIRLRVDVRKDATLIPVPAVQRGTPGTFVYVVNDDKTVALRPVKLGPTSGETVSITDGLKPGEQVVIDGADKLKQGAKVEVAQPDVRRPAGGAGQGERRRRRPGQEPGADAGAKSPAPAGTVGAAGTASAAGTVDAAGAIGTAGAIGADAAARPSPAPGADDSSKTPSSGQKTGP